MKYSIVIFVKDSNEVNLFTEFMLYGLKKFINQSEVKDTFVIIAHDLVTNTEFIKKFEKDQLTFISKEKYNEYTISNIITTQYYLLLTENDILIKPLSYKDFFYKNKIRCTLETFPHGSLNMTTHRQQWYDVFSHLEIGITPDFYDYKCMSIGPQLIDADLVKIMLTHHNFDSFTSFHCFYWFFCYFSNFTDNYIEFPLWNPEVRFNARHREVHSDYLSSNIITGFQSEYKFLKICTDVVKETFFEKVSVPSLSNLKEMMDKLKLYKTDHQLIHLGENRDGGYVIADLKEKNPKLMISFGVGSTCKFELDYATMNKADCFMFDHTVKQLNPIKTTEWSIIHKKLGVGDYCYGNILTLEKVMELASIEETKDIFLKMDVEGYEWLTILSTPKESLKRFSQIVIEFHWLDTDQNATSLQKLEVLEKLAETHIPIHVHGVNCRKPSIKNGFKIHPVIEVTYLRKDFIKSEVSYVPKLPLSIDCPTDLCLNEISMNDYYPFIPY